MHACVQVVNVTGLSVVVGLMSAADTLCPQVLSCMAIESVQCHIIIMLAICCTVGLWIQELYKGWNHSTARYIIYISDRFYTSEFCDQ